MENLSLSEVKRKLVIWNRMADDPETMTVAKGLVMEVIEKLTDLKKKLDIA